MQALRAYRRLEGLLLALVLLLGVMGALLVAVPLHPSEAEWGAWLRNALLPPLAVGILFGLVHTTMNLRKIKVDQVILPVVAFLVMLGLTIITRLRGTDVAWQQITRGLIPGLLGLSALIFWPRLSERIRQLAIPISLAGLGLALLTGVLGSADETGARLALKLGPLPAIQTSEMIKVALMVFLAWFIDREGERVEARATVILGGLRIPALRHFLPGLLFVGVATMALVRMSDFGAVMILGIIFIAMLYAGFDTRLFATIALAGAAMALLVALVLIFAWEVPAVIANRFLAFTDPWSTAELMVNGQPSGITISEGPGYQIQQAIYATLAGGLTGTGLGLGSPGFIPLGASDFIYASLLEELGAIVGFAVLAFYGILIVRAARVAMLLPAVQVFERMLVIGIAIHFFTQVFIMVGGTLNLIPLTGVTVPFLSLGGSALMVNLIEVGIVLSLAQRVEAAEL